MSELDRYFGPKKNIEMPAAKISYFGRYPDVEELCDAFLEFMGWGTDSYTIQQIVAGARDFKLAIGNKPKLLIRTLEKMKRKKLSIGSPRSAINPAREMLHSPDADSDEHRQKYLKGVDDETR